ncbi:MAG: 1-acyl-sn-glycerol-3-phosphate acyltransferase [Candidatus Promineifilaceae bacterium]
MLYYFSRIVLRILGWKVEGETPTISKYVLIMAPHTSRLDGILLLLSGYALRMPINWIVAQDAVQGILHPVVKRLGAVPIDRTQNRNVVSAMVDEFKVRDALALAIAPMGMTRYSDHWRSGFYRIATQADVPLIFSYLDWGTKRLGVSQPYKLTGDISADMDVIREFYGDMTGKFPKNLSRIRLKLEDGNAGA